LAISHRPSASHTRDSSLGELWPSGFSAEAGRFAELASASQAGAESTRREQCASDCSCPRAGLRARNQIIAEAGDLQTSGKVTVHHRVLLRPQGFEALSALAPDAQTCAQALAKPVTCPPLCTSKPSLHLRPMNAWYGMAGQIMPGPGRAGPGSAGQCRAARGEAGLGRAGPGLAGQGRAGTANMLLSSSPQSACSARTPRAPGSSEHDRPGSGTHRTAQGRRLLAM